MRYNMNIESFKNDKPVETVKIGRMEPIEKHINLISDKDKIGLIKHIESIIRTSVEYKMYISYLRKFIKMNKCSFMARITNAEGKKVSIEIHHEPFTLFDLTQIVLEKYKVETGETNIYDIAEEVMLLHYRCMVGLLPLSKTVHKLYHLGRIFIPLDAPRGDYLLFLEQYDKYITDESGIRQILEDKLIKTKQVNDLSILNTKYVYIEIDGQGELKPVTREELNENNVI